MDTSLIVRPIANIQEKSNLKYAKLFEQLLLHMKKEYGIYFR